ncbi:cytochrome P450 [Humibacter sp. RRB41]|uniref:cytochrome P450 n=1 Tax=Humibacter sp. RRB41 TaxID=2919946 RepID=UPI001FAAD524|nr:cytochrome P450 [Humibacter sp. RRB41]
MTLTSYFRTPHHATTDVDISSVAFWQRDFRSRDDAFRRLRRSVPVSWHPPLQTPGLPKRYREAGFWAVTTAEAIAHISRQPEVFSSEIGQVGVRPAPFRLSANMLVTDPPRHSEYRRLIGSAFTPRAVARLEHGIKRRAMQIVGRAALHEEFDFVAEIATQLPMGTIADLIGVPEAEHERFVQLADAYVHTRVPSDLQGHSASEFVANSGEYLRELCLRLCSERRREPADDLITALVQGSLEGHPMGEEEILSTVLLLITAGDDTTTQATTLSFLALQQFPEQREWLSADFDARFDTAFDELIRFASPVLSFARTATSDTEFDGQHVTAGDKVALFYCSGNRDETLFPDPHSLDLTRQPNRHVAFGGGGVHYCLGAALAKTQIHAVLGEVLRRLPEVELGEPEFGFSDAIHSVDALAVRNSNHRRGGA